MSHKLMTAFAILVSTTSLTALSSSFASVALADDGVVHTDQGRIQQDKANLRRDRQNIKLAKAAVVTDKQSGNVTQLTKDRSALHEARQSKRNDRTRLAQDRAEKNHDVTHP